MNMNFGRFLAMGALMLTVGTAVTPAMAHTSDDNPPADTSMTNVTVKAFLDTNGNGKWDAGEPDANAWYKLTGGGDWYVCNFVGAGDTSSTTVVRDNGYYILPVALPGYRVTTPVVNATFNEPDAPTVNLIGVIKDPNAKFEGCGDGMPNRALGGN